ncbi:hypothetical protein [Aeromicrobium sp. Sec7.5]|uniref:hypothetical protein n=1 Tax=Aeromicrobium sp. Sec7.5 TaxID=3121276 RepID=UPI002FE432DB
MAEQRDETARERRERLRRAAEILGDPGTPGARDDSDEGWGDGPSRGAGGNDADLRRNVPPHHG